MKTIDEDQLKLEISHIFESGANEMRILNMVKLFVERRGVLPSFEPQQKELTKREYFAIMAMSNFNSSMNCQETSKNHKQLIAEIAVDLADELIKALNKDIAD